MNTLHNFAFNVYPYLCLAVFFMGSLARFDREQALAAVPMFFPVTIVGG